MNIGIDTRTSCQNPYYAYFIKELIEVIAQSPSSHTFCVYIHKDDEILQDLFSLDAAHISLKKIPWSSKSWLENRKAKKLFENERYHMMIFFDTHIPFGYQHPYVIILESLKDIFFKKTSYLEKKLLKFQLAQIMKHCYKCICLDSQAPLKLNEHLNIPESILGHIPGFFPKYPSKIQALAFDVRTKHQIKTPYLIYDSGNEVHNNFERILKSFKQLRDENIAISLVILCDATSNDVDIREKIISYRLAGNVYFLGTVEEKYEKAYYDQSLGVIFSSIYESFPFHFTKAMHYKQSILANNIQAHQEVVQDAIVYLDPLSVHIMTDSLKAYVQNAKNTHVSYDALYKKYTAKKTLTALLLHIEK